MLHVQNFLTNGYGRKLPYSFQFHSTTKYLIGTTNIK
jgi:hypothetical protein